ncbi:riboflavin biosynthesis protein RibF [Berryella wangjianweii]|nr:riboflavin biosynthesis protein RibF [Berryella wangjianweii]
MAELIMADETFDVARLEGAVCAFGVFDGVHRAHRFLIGQAVAQARELEKHAVALTFDIDPDEVFHADRLRKLMTNDDRLRALADTGVDAVVAFPFTEAFAGQPPADFMQRAFGAHVPRALHVGHGLRFGARASGTVADLERWGAVHGMEVHAHTLVQAEGSPISATRIRLLLQEGKVSEARDLLGRPYRIVGRVVPGRGEGAQMGFSTANLSVPPACLALGEGVYAGYARIDGETYRAAVSVGVSPVFSGRTDAVCEAHLLDFQGTLYGAALSIDVTHFLRPMIKFDTVDELIRTVLANIAWVRQHL